MQQIAVIQTAFPGDVILSTPIFEALKEKFPGCVTVAVIRPESISLLENNPHVDTIETFDKYGADRGISGILSMAGRLKGFDKAYVIQRYFRSAAIAYWAGIPERIGFDNSSAKLLYTQKVKYRKELHEVKRCLSLVGSEESGYRPKIILDDESKEKAESHIKSFGITNDFAVVAPGSVWPTKRYPYYPGLIHLINEKLKMPVILLGGRDDAKTAGGIAKGCVPQPFDLVGRTSLLQSAALISKARIIFANDSAPAHIAAAMGTPVVAIFGPTVPSFGFAPYSENSAVVDIGELDCRPCTTHGSQKCPRKHFKCMMELQPTRIIEAAISLLGR